MSECSLISKLVLLPGCRPWDGDNENGIQIQPPPKVERHQSRVARSAQLDVQTAPWYSGAWTKITGAFGSTVQTDDNQGNMQATEQCAWYSKLNPLSQCNDVTRTVTGLFSTSNLMKVLVITVIASMLLVFASSFGKGFGSGIARKI